MKCAIKCTSSQEKPIVGYLHSEKAVKQLQLMLDCIKELQMSTFSTDVCLKCNGSFQKPCAICRNLFTTGLTGGFSLKRYKSHWDELPSLRHQNYQLKHLLNLQFLLCLVKRDSDRETGPCSGWWYMKQFNWSLGFQCCKAFFLLVGGSLAVL